MRARNLPPLLVASAVFSLPLSDMHLSAQGSLDPPGPPEPTQKSLQEIWDKLEAVESKNDTLQATVDALQATVSELHRWAEKAMPTTPDEIRRREIAARAAIKRAFEEDHEELGARLFVSHHLLELDPDYWKRHLSAEEPSPAAVLDLLELRKHWGGDDEISMFDFTLPDDVTNYVICVRFDDEGHIDDVVMES